MITFYNPSPIEYLFREANNGSMCNPDIFKRIKFIFMGSVISALAAALQGFYTLKVIGNYIFSFIVPSHSENITFSNLLLESYKTFAFTISVFVLPILLNIKFPKDIIQLYKDLKLFKSQALESIPNVKNNDVFKLDIQTLEPNPIIIDNQEPKLLENQTLEPNSIIIDNNDLTLLENQTLEPVPIVIDNIENQDLTLLVNQTVEPTSIIIDNQEPTFLENQTLEPAPIIIDNQEPTLIQIQILEPTPFTESYIIEEDNINKEPMANYKTYQFYKNNYEKLKISARKAYIQSRLSSLPLTKKKNRMYVLLNYLNKHNVKFNQEVGYYRLSSNILLKEELELRLVSNDISNENLLNNVGDSCDDRNLVCGVLKDLVKSCQLFPYKSNAYKQLLNAKSSKSSVKDTQQSVLNSMADPLKKEIFVNLIRHLSGIAANKDQNLMDAKNLAIVFAPNIDSEPDALKSLKSNQVIIDFLQKSIYCKQFPLEE